MDKFKTAAHVLATSTFEKGWKSILYEKVKNKLFYILDSLCSLMNTGLNSQTLEDSNARVTAI